MDEKLVTITLKEYEGLCKIDKMLDCLIYCGVDNWSGFSEAMRMFEEGE